MKGRINVVESINDKLKRNQENAFADVKAFLKDHAKLNDALQGYEVFNGSPVADTAIVRVMHDCLHVIYSPYFNLDEYVSSNKSRFNECLAGFSEDELKTHDYIINDEASYGYDNQMPHSQREAILLAVVVRTLEDSYVKALKSEMDLAFNLEDVDQQREIFDKIKQCSNVISAGGVLRGRLEELVLLLRQISKSYSSKKDYQSRWLRSRLYDVMSDFEKSNRIFHSSPCFSVNQSSYPFARSTLERLKLSDNELPYVGDRAYLQKADLFFNDCTSADFKAGLNESQQVYVLAILNHAYLSVAETTFSQEDFIQATKGMTFDHIRKAVGLTVSVEHKADYIEALSLLEITLPTNETAKLKSDFIEFAKAKYHKLTLKYNDTNEYAELASLCTELHYSICALKSDDENIALEAKNHFVLRYITALISMEMLEAVGEDNIRVKKQKLKMFKEEYKRLAADANSTADEYDLLITACQSAVDTIQYSQSEEGIHERLNNERRVFEAEEEAKRRIEEAKQKNYRYMLARRALEKESAINQLAVFIKQSVLDNTGQAAQSITLANTAIYDALERMCHDAIESIRTSQAHEENFAVIIARMAKESEEVNVKARQVEAAKAETDARVEGLERVRGTVEAEVGQLKLDILTVNSEKKKLVSEVENLRADLQAKTEELQRVNEPALSSPFNGVIKVNVKEGAWKKWLRGILIGAAMVIGVAAIVAAAVFTGGGALAIAGFAVGGALLGGGLVGAIAEGVNARRASQALTPVNLSPDLSRHGSTSQFGPELGLSRGNAGSAKKVLSEPGGEAVYQPVPNGLGLTQSDNRQSCFGRRK